MKLNEIQQALKVPKNHLNKFGGYNYRNAEDILEAVKPLLGDSTLTLSDEVVNVGDRYYVKATAEFKEQDAIVLGAVRVTAYAREEETKKGMDGAQITGAASSYARKYALNGLFLIDDTKDADSDDGTVPSKTHLNAPSATKPAQSDKDTIKALLKQLGHEPKTVTEAKEVIEFLTDITYTEQNYEAIIDELRKQVDN